MQLNRTTMMTPDLQTLGLVCYTVTGVEAIGSYANAAYVLSYKDMSPGFDRIEIYL